MLKKLKTFKVSKHLRHSVFSRKFIGRSLGLQIAGLATVMSVVAYPTHAFDYTKSADTTAGSTTLAITTPSAFDFPLTFTQGMSQSFHAFHPGVDLMAPKGTPVLAMDEGIVVEVEYGWIGYGHMIRIAHAGTLSSLYAHLSTILVKPGDKVTKGQEIGTVGVTGWSTGPHLHFEVHQADKAVSPLAYISVSTVNLASR